MIATGAGRPEPPRASGVPRPPSPSAPGRRETRKPAGLRSDLRGRVVAPDGKPVAGAAVRTAYLDRRPGPRDDQRAGRPVHDPPGQTRGQSAIGAYIRAIPWVVATAPGFGPGWARASTGPGTRDETRCRLAPRKARRSRAGSSTSKAGPSRCPGQGGRDRSGMSARETSPPGSAQPHGCRGNLWQGLCGWSNWLDRTLLPIEARSGPDGRFRLSGTGQERSCRVDDLRARDRSRPRSRS